MEIGGTVEVIIGLAQQEAPSVEKKHKKNDKANGNICNDLGILNAGLFS